MTEPDQGMDQLPEPPRLPKPMPNGGKEGWWIGIGGDPRRLRYHDGTDWTTFVCQLRLRGPGEIERDPLPALQDPSISPDPEIRRLPPPPRAPDYYPDSRPASGWFKGMFGRPERGLARYIEDYMPTEFVVEILDGGVGPIHRRPIKH